MFKNKNEENLVPNIHFNYIYGVLMTHMDNLKYVSSRFSSAKSREKYLTELSQDGDDL